jgi:DNA invertase Pin-like site-specific DNA recombinase
MAINKLIATNLAAIATFENERRKERQPQGIQAAGKYMGRKTLITKKLIEEVRNLKENKNLSITQIAKVTGSGRTTIYKVLK